jgi:hypothetical protein
MTMHGGGTVQRRYPTITNTPITGEGIMSHETITRETTTRRPHSRPSAPRTAPEPFDIDALLGLADGLREDLLQVADGGVPAGESPSLAHGLITDPPVIDSLAIDRLVIDPLVISCPSRFATKAEAADIAQQGAGTLYEAHGGLLGYLIVKQWQAILTDALDCMSSDTFGQFVSKAK